MGLAFALILIGINSQAGWLFWLASMLLAALLVSWLLSVFQVRGLGVERAHKPEVVEDELLETKLFVHNRGRLSRSLLEVIDSDPCRPQKRLQLRPPRKSIRELWRDPSPPLKPSPDRAGGQGAFLLPRLPGKTKTTITYTRGALRRGVYEDWPAFFYSEGVIGLARHASRINPSSRLVVFPSYAKLRYFPFVDSFFHPQYAPRAVSFRGAGMDYYGVREYRAGDPLRHVHWRTTARRGQLAVKEFETEIGVPLLILVDNRAGTGAEVLDSAARLAASVARYAHYAGHPVTLACYKGRELELLQIPTFRAALQWLAALSAESRLAPEEQAKGLEGRVRGGCFFCHILPAAPFDADRLAAALPPHSQAALILIDLPSHQKHKASPSIASEAMVEGLLSSPFPGLFSVSLYRKGDDLRECLESSLITCAGSRSLEI
jgi:uncharacterized protein (DUF58 family)